MNPFFRIKDVRFKTSHSSGPGGQNVNRRSTKVQARIPVSKLLLTEVERARVIARLAHRVNLRGELEAESEEERTQEGNKRRALESLNNLIARAVKVPKRRIPTKISKTAEARFQERKKKEAEKKRLRKFLPKEWLE